MGVQIRSTATQHDADSTAATTEEVDGDTTPSEPDPSPGCEDGRPVRWANTWTRILAYGVLPGLAMLLAIAAGLFKWHDASARGSELARIESVAAATDSTVALLSYQPDSVERDLEAARDKLTGSFKESYTQLTNDVVIPGAKQKRISAVASVPAASPVSATPGHAVVLLFVNQTAVVGSEPPTDTASSVRVTLDKVDGRWLISAFDPV